MAAPAPQPIQLPPALRAEIKDALRPLVVAFAAMTPAERAATLASWRASKEARS